jgi:Uma2 family endonuclease
MATVVFEDRVRIPADVVDLASFRRWARSDEFPDTGHIAFLAGEVLVDMSPEELVPHGKLKRDLQHGLHARLERHEIGELLPDRTLFVDERANVANEPDLMFVSWDALRTGRTVYLPQSPGSSRLVEVGGAPDVVVEIVSRSSVRKDTQLLPPWYFAAGVREFWLLDARGPELRFDLHVRGASDWTAVAPDADGFRTSDVLGAALRIDRGTNPVGGVRFQVVWK